jgi:Family of unknown function (DUF6212)
MTKILFFADNVLYGQIDFLKESDNVVYLKIDDFLKENLIISTHITTNSVFNSPFIAGFLLSDKNLDQKKDIFKKLNELIPHFHSNFIHVFSDYDNKTITWMANAVIQLANLIIANATCAQKESAELRILYQRVQASLFEIERTPTKCFPNLVFQTFPGDNTQEISDVPLCFESIDIYSVLHAIDIFFVRDAYILSSADVLVELTGSHSGRDFACWSIKDAFLKEGWNRFYCPVKEEAFGEPVIISLRSTSLRSQFLLAGSPANNEMQPSEFPPFALRLWSGVVSKCFPRTLAGYSTDGSANNDCLKHLGVELLQLAMPLNMNLKANIAWDQTKNGLMVHPSGIEPVTVQITNLETFGLKKITISFKLAHVDAKATEFSAWIVPRIDLSAERVTNKARMGRFFRRDFLSKKNSNLISSSFNIKSLVLVGNQEGEIYLNFDPSYDGKFDLFLSTRNLDEHSDYAWAVFTDIHFETI